MKPVQDITLPLPAPPDPAIIASAAKHGRRAAGIYIGIPEPPDPAGTVARFAWPVPGRPWIARGTLGRRRDLLEVTTLQLTPLPGGADGAVTSDLLRAVSLTAITAAAQAHLALTALAEDELAAVTRTEPRPAAGHAVSFRPSGQGRPPLPRTLLRQAAEAFLDEAARGPGIYDRIALRLEDIAGHPFTEGKVRHALARAQQDGWLTRGKRGSRQRSPGPRLLTAWEQERTALRRPLLAIGYLPHIAEPVLPARSPPVRPADQRIGTLQVLHVHVVALEPDAHVPRRQHAVHGTLLRRSPPSLQPLWQIRETRQALIPPMRHQALTVEAELSLNPRDRERAVVDHHHRQALHRPIQIPVSVRLTVHRPLAQDGLHGVSLRELLALTSQPAFLLQLRPAVLALIRELPVTPVMLSLDPDTRPPVNPQRNAHGRHRRRNRPERRHDARPVRAASKSDDHGHEA